MTCSHFQDQMLLSFGEKQISDELRRHLAECAACRDIWRELSDLKGRLGSDDLFYPDDTLVEESVTKVNAAIESAESKRIQSPPIRPSVRKIWYTYVPVAAAVVLALGIALGSYLTGRLGFEKQLTSSVSDDTTYANSYSEDYEELDDTTVGALIYDFTAQHTYEASERLLDDLTDEELRFLEDNFDVGDLL